MSDKPKDKASEPIHHTEAYRLARRNVLFWAMATILIAMGTADADHPIEVTGVVRNLSFEQGFLTFSSLLVLLFMAISYFRAERVLLKHHSGFAFARKMEELSNVAEQAVTNLADVNEIALRARAQLEHEIAKVEVAHSDAIALVTHDYLVTPGGNDDVPWQQDGAWEHMARSLQLEIGHALRGQERPRDVDSVIEAAARQAAVLATTTLRRNIENWRGGLEQARTKFLSTLPEKAELEGISKQNDLMIANLVETPKRLLTISVDVMGEERFWFWALDRGVPYLVTAVASAIGIWRLRNPDALASTLAFWF